MADSSWEVKTRSIAWQVFRLQGWIETWRYFKSQYVSVYSSNVFWRILSNVSICIHCSPCVHSYFHSLFVETHGDTWRHSVHWASSKSAALNGTPMSGPRFEEKIHQSNTCCFNSLYHFLKYTFIVISLFINLYDLNLIKSICCSPQKASVFLGVWKELMHSRS